MKKLLLIFGTTALILAGCKDETFYCVDIGNSLKPWTVYDLNDTIVMEDQLGNSSVVVLDHYANKAPYYMKEAKGWMKKKAVCVGSLEIWSSVNFFSLNVESGAPSFGEIRHPNSYSLQLSIMDAMATFNVSMVDGVETIFSTDPQVNVNAVDYTSIGGTLYPEALVFNADTTISNVNTYNFVYVKNQGLVEFSTKMPQRTWKVQ